MNNNNISLSINQAFSQQCLNIAYWLGGSLPATFVPEKLSEIFTLSRQKMFKCILRSINIHNSSFISLTTIGKAGNVNRQAAAEFLDLCETLGIFKIIRRGKERKSNIYSLGEVLKNSAVRWSLRDVFLNLTRSYTKMVDAIKGMSACLETPINKQKRTLLININVFKKKYTSSSSYRERVLHSTPFLPKQDWLNQQKALWADWSLTPGTYMTKNDYQKYYGKSDFPENEIKRKIQTQSEQQRFNKRKYPSDFPSLTPAYDPFHTTDSDSHNKYSSKEIYQKSLRKTQLIIDPIRSSTVEARKKPPAEFKRELLSHAQSSGLDDAARVFLNIFMDNAEG